VRRVDSHWPEGSARPSERPVAEATTRCIDGWDRIAVAASAFQLAAAHGWAEKAARELSIAASELASNVVRHGGGGAVTVRVLRASIELCAEDAGPGIADPTAAMRDGHSRGRDLGPDDARSCGLGAGLGAVARLMDRVVIEHRAPIGTRVRAIRARR
jgi:anti-sigma regulatory factor (Ser/Thr protein kinase)